MMADLKKNYGHNVFDDIFPRGLADYRASYTLSHPWKIVFYAARHIKWAWQRVFRGWDDRIIWNIDLYLAEMIPAWIEKLIECKLGVNAVFFKKAESPENPEAEKVARNAQEKIYRKMIAGFHKYQIINESWENPEDDPEYAEGFDLFRKYFGTLWS